MKKLTKFMFLPIAIGLLFVATSAFATVGPKLVSKTTHISFFSHTAVEDIEANNYKAISTINPETGDVVFSIPMQSFEFEKRMMQKHFNGKKFLETKTYPKAKMKGKIANLADIDFTTDGTYQAKVEGKMTIKGVTNEINEMGTITIKNGMVSVSTEFNIHLPDYKIAFKKGKPSKNIAKTIKVKVLANY